MPYYEVAYTAGTYSGVRGVNAVDEDEAIARVRSRVRKEMSEPMYSDSYEIAKYPDETPDYETDY